jgi:predicted metal-dependent hydrolase
MERTRLEGIPPIDVDIRRSRRARRISLRLSGIDGRVTLTLPPRIPERTGLAFLREKEPWLREHLAAQPRAVIVGAGAVIPVEGVPHVIRCLAGPGGSVPVARGGALAVPGPEARIPARVLAYLKARARDRLAAASDHYAARLDRPYTRLTLRDTRSRWGSCSSAGGLMYSWRLILAPPEVLAYVAAHEVAHLAEMNHSRAFWETVARIHGPYEGPRGWLRANGSGLHRYRF